MILTSAMDALAEKLFENLDHLQLPQDQDAAVALLKDFKQSLDDKYAYPFQYYNTARTMIRTRYGSGSVAQLAKKLIHMSKEQMVTASAKAAARVRARNDQQTVLLYSFVLKRVEWLKSNGLLIDKVILLMLASGSRRCEIMGTGRSDFVEAGPRHIEQLGLAKKTKHTRVEKVIKPLLFFSSAEFLAMLEDVRAATADLALDAKKLVSIFDSRLETLSRLCWPQFVSNGYPIGTHVCRTLYSSIAFQMHAPVGVSMPAFVARVLGHESLMTVPNYLYAKVTFDVSGPAYDEAVAQYNDCIDRLVPVTLIDESGNEHEILGVPHRRLTKAEREELRYNRIRDLEERHIPALKSYLRLLNIE